MPYVFRRCAFDSASVVAYVTESAANHRLIIYKPSLNKTDYFCIYLGIACNNSTSLFLTKLIIIQVILRLTIILIKSLMQIIRQNESSAEIRQNEILQNETYVTDS